MRIGGIVYPGDATVMTTAAANYETTWSLDPSTGLSWTRAGVALIQNFGHKLISQSSETSGCSARITQEYMKVRWFPTRPIVTLGLYKNDVLLEAAYVPIHEASTVSYQTVPLHTMVDLVAGDNLRVKISKTMENDVLLVDSKYTYIAIHRLSGTVDRKSVV